MKLAGQGVENPWTLFTRRSCCKSDPAGQAFIEVHGHHHPNYQKNAVSNKY
jgi:hypothetical protein